MNKLLTIGMATYDDFEGIYFTIQALRMYHPICNTEKIEFLIVDDNPQGVHGQTIKNLFAPHIPNLRYIANDKSGGTSTRNKVFENAEGKYTLCIDCHILIESGGIDTLLNYYHENPDTSDLIQGPLWYDNLRDYSTHLKPTWGACMYGQWDTMKHDDKAFEIPMQGLGLFSCKTDKWLKFNEKFKGFGAEEGYIHAKYRKEGHKVICLPNLKWVHRFNRPNGIPYPNNLVQRFTNYIIGWKEVLETTEHPFFKEIMEAFKDNIPEGVMTQIIKKI